MANLESYLLDGNNIGSSIPIGSSITQAADEIADVLSMIHALHALAIKDGNPAAYNILRDVQTHIAATSLGQKLSEYLQRLRAMLRPALPYCNEGHRSAFLIGDHS